MQREFESSIANSNNDFEKYLQRILRSALPRKGSWTYSKMHVGTNYITKATNATTKETFIVKVYNKASKVDHRAEHAIIGSLCKAGLHPGVVCFSEDYRIEEFVENASIGVFQLRMMPKLLRVVELIASLHSNSLLKSQILPLIEDKQPFVLALNTSWLNTFLNLHPTIQETLRGTKYESFGDSLGYLLTADFRILLDSLTPHNSKVVLSHNDVSAANLMHSKHAMYLIDYEYCRPNFRGYDLAVLVEDVTTDYEHPQYPNFVMRRKLALSRKEENVLLRHYIRCCGLATSKALFKAELTKLRKEVRSLRVLFQLAGTLWGLTTHDWEDAEFDEDNCWRIEYAKQRWHIFADYVKNSPV